MDEEKEYNHIKLVQGPFHMKIQDIFSLFLSFLAENGGNRDKELSLMLFWNLSYTWYFSEAPAKRCTTSLVMHIGLLV